MTKLLQRVDITLRSFYVFNSGFGKKEGDEHKKIIYYHPEDIEVNTKIKDVGLSEAIITFSSNFTSDSGCKALHTQKTTQLFYQAEPGYWMVLVLNVPKEIRCKDGVDITDYHGGEVQDRIYTATLEQCYKVYRLFNGTFHSVIENSSNIDAVREKLQERLKLFFDKHLQTLKLPISQFNDVTRSIQYLPLDKSFFLRAHNLMNMVRASFLLIEETILLNDEQVVCSGNIDPHELYSLHEYIVGALGAKDSPISPFSTNNSSANRTEVTSDGAFVHINKSTMDEVPHVYLHIGQRELKAYQIVIFRALNATICLLANGNETLRPDFYSEFQSYVGPQLSSLARDIAAVVQNSSSKKKQTPSPTNVAPASASSMDECSPKYLFVNEQSLKHLSNIPIDKRRTKLAISHLPTNVLNLIVDLSSNFGKAASTSEQNKSSAPEFEEVQIKTTTDFWIVKRRCNWRQYFVIIFNNKATLLDVTQEAKRIFEQELTDAVFFDK